MIYLIDGAPTEAPLRDPLNSLCINLFAGRANEDELFRAHSKFWDRAEVLHGIAAGEAHYGRRAVAYSGRAFDGGGSGRVIQHCDSTETCGSATKLSATDAGTGLLSVMEDM